MWHDADTVDQVRHRRGNVVGQLAGDGSDAHVLSHFGVAENPEPRLRPVEWAPEANEPRRFGPGDASFVTAPEYVVDGGLSVA